MLARALALLLSLTASAAWAKCRTDGILAFPAPGAVVPLNVKFILEGAGKQRDKVAALVGKTLVLKAKNPQVPPVSVKVKAGWTSAMLRTAVVLLPAQTLAPEQEYSLLIDQALGDYKVLNERALDRLAWTTAKNEDRTPPKYQVRPTVAEGISERDGDGATRYLKLRTQLTEEGPAYFLVRLVLAAKATGQKQVYPVPINGSEALIGQDACSGSFALEPNRTYRIDVETYDSAGNKVAERVPTIEAKSPLAAE